MDDLAAATFLSENDKTVKTEETIEVSNHDFLSAVFHTRISDASPVVSTFSGSPTERAGRGWPVRRWTPDTKTEQLCPPEHNNYFTVATFYPNTEGNYRRKKENFAALHALMLDDVGTKVARDLLQLEPSWLIETSDKNFQAGYILAEPLQDLESAKQLMNAVIAAGLCDPGANGVGTRLARLPVAINGKHDPAFRCAIHMWAPEQRYSALDLVKGLGLTLHTSQSNTPKKSASSAPTDDGPAYISPAAENTVLATLKREGLYKAELESGKHDITCPWVREHTGSVDDGCAYFEPTTPRSSGAFKCHHGHCSKRGIRDLLKILGVEAAQTRACTTIRVRAGFLHLVVEAAERSLEAAGGYYQRAGQIVTIITDPGTRDTHIHGMTQPALVSALSAAAAWERFDGRSQEWAPCDPPARHVAALLAAAEFQHLPALSGLARQPYLLPDGGVVSYQGYCAESRIFGVFDESEFDIPDAPSREQAESALKQLKELLTEFSFATSADESAALSALLTAAARPSLPFAPMYHVKAPMVGSGKSYLCQLISAFATAQAGTPLAFPPNDEECAKLLSSELLRAPAVINFDNITSDIAAHMTLCTALTSEHISARILGKSEMVRIPTRTLFLSSGNNVGPVLDMTRRCVTILLSPMCEMPATRTFSRPNLVDEIASRRGEYVSAALTIIRAWISAGKPRTKCPVIGSFGLWSDYCRQPLLWLGHADPAESISTAMAEDPERELLHRFMRQWHQAFGFRPARIRDAVNRAEASHGGSPELKDVLHEIAGDRGEINRKSLGWWMRRMIGKIVDGHVLRRSSGGGSVEQWAVAPVSKVSGLSWPSAQNDLNVSEAYRKASNGE